MRAAALAVLWAALAVSAGAQVTLAAPPPVTLADGERATLAFRATAADTTAVEVRVAGPEGWRTLGGRALTLAPGTRTVFVIAAPPESALAATYPIRVALIAGPDTLATAQVGVTVPARRSARVEALPPIRPLVAGTAAALPIRVSNDGNVALTLDLAVGAPFGWGARLGQRSVAVAPGATVETALRLEPPPGLVDSRGARLTVTASDAASALVVETDLRVLAVPEPGALRLALHDLPGRVGIEAGSRSGISGGGTEAGALVSFDAAGALREGGAAQVRVSVRAPAYGATALTGRDLYRAELAAPGAALSLGDSGVDHGPLAGVVVGAGLAGEAERGAWRGGAFALADRSGYVAGDRVAGLRAMRTWGGDSLRLRVGATGLARTGPLAGSLVGLRAALDRGDGVRIDLEGGVGHGRGATALGGAARVDVRRGAGRVTGWARATPAAFPLLTAGTVEGRGEALYYLGRGHLAARGTRYRVLARDGRDGLLIESARLSGRSEGGVQGEAGTTRYVFADRELAERAIRLRGPVRLGLLRGDLRAYARRRIADADRDVDGGADASTRLRLGSGAELLVGLGGSASSRTGPAWRPSLGAAVRPVASVLIRATAFAALRVREGARDEWGVEGSLSWTDRSGRRLSARVLRVADEADVWLAGSRWQAQLTLSQPLALPLARSRASGAVRGRVIDPETGAGRGGVPVFVGSTVALSAPDGTFALSGLAPGAYELTLGGGAAEASSFALGVVPLRVGGGEITTLADLTAPEGATLAGRAVFREGSRTGARLEGPGRPLAGVGVEVVGEGGAVVSGVTDADGGFRFVGLLPGRYLVRLLAETLPRGAQSEPVAVDLASGAVEAVTVEAAPRRRTFRQLD